ncbi:hypothetical protein TNCV_1720751 [Trichonephila clavipes]|nr:hypothetical protein TNCV_1720751 [Trichonephila clavipes]
MNSDAVAQPVTVEEEKDLSRDSSNVPPIFAEDETYETPTKFLALSDDIVAHFPRLATKRFNVARKASVVKSETISRWTAFKAKQTKMATYILWQEDRKWLLTLRDREMLVESIKLKMHVLEDAERFEA